MSEQFSADPVARAEEFLAAFNRIDDFLRQKTGIMDRSKSFSEVLRRFFQMNPAYARYKSKIESFVDLRNVLVHEHKRAREYVAYPSEMAFLDIRVLEKGLLSPAPVLDVANRTVKAFSPTTALVEMLAVIREEDFSQFPVYGEGGDFLGLATANGLSRWFARLLDADQSLIDIDDHLIEEVLEFGEGKGNCEFVSRSLPAREALHLFANNSLLEAVIVTETGNPQQRPLGILTRWDAVGDFQELA